MKHRYVGKESDKSGEERESNILLFSEVSSWLVNCPSTLRKFSMEPRQEFCLGVGPLIQGSARCVQISEPSKGSKNDLCDFKNSNCNAV